MTGVFILKIMFLNPPYPFPNQVRDRLFTKGGNKIDDSSLSKGRLGGI